MAQAISVNVVGVGERLVGVRQHTYGVGSGRGVLVNMSSGAATKPYEGWAAYCASKAAVDQMTRVVALEEARHDLFAYAVAPGLVDTDMQTAIRGRGCGVVPRAWNVSGRVAERQRFNSPGWVADHILSVGVRARSTSGSVTLRIPDQPTTSASASSSGLAG